MNLDYLISKYLDGELSDADDALLRSKLSEDKAAKDSFDSAIMLHLACKEDAESINPPKALIKDTEDIILMKILSQQEIIQDKPAYFRTFYKYAGALTVFLFLFIFKIYDSSIINNTNFISHILNEDRNVLIANYNENVEYFASIKSPKVQKTSINEKLNKKIDREEDFIIADVVDNDVERNSIAGSLDNKPETSITEENYDVNRANINNDLFNNTQPDVIRPNMNYNAFTPINPNNLNPKEFVENKQNHSELLTEALKNNISYNHDQILNPANEVKVNDYKSLSLTKLDYYNETTEIQVSSFFGTDIARENIDAKNKSYISHFSQSVAYPFKKNHRLGVELGYTEYAYNELTMVKTPVNDPDGLIGKVEISDLGLPGNSGNEYIETTITFSQTKQIFWGAAFYEYSMMEFDDLSMNGRLGIGSSKEGPVGYGRLFAKYEVLSGVYFTLGAEGRMFVAGLPVLTKTQSDLKATASIIYGFQVKF